MSNLAALFVGLLAGWLIEWMIDYFYWRKQNARLISDLQQCCEQVDTLKQEKEELISQLDELAQEKEQKPVKTARKIKKSPDDLQVIKGIGKKISRILNDNGIATYQQLASIKPDRLREILGDKIKRLADEEEIISQAKKLAKKRS